MIPGESNPRDGEQVPGAGSVARLQRQSSRNWSERTGGRVCSSCGQSKSLTEFYESDPYRCKDCTRSRSRSNARRDPDRRADNQRRRREAQDVIESALYSLAKRDFEKFMEELALESARREFPLEEVMAVLAARRGK